MIGAIAADRRRPRQGLRRRQLRLGEWHRGDLSLEERARQHARYEDWILNQVAPFVHADAGCEQGIMVTGVSFGAYHAANFALKRADLFPLAICQSGVYDVSVVGGGERGDAVTSTIPWTTSLTSVATTSTGSATASASCSCAARGSGRTRRERWRARSGSRRSSARRASGTSSICGVTTSRTTGPRGGRRSLIICLDSFMMRPRWRHLIGLLLGTEEDWPRAFEHVARAGRPDPVRRRDARARRRSGSRTSRSTCATGRATGS